MESDSTEIGLTSSMGILKSLRISVRRSPVTVRCTDEKTTDTAGSLGGLSATGAVSRCAAWRSPSRPSPVSTDTGSEQAAHKAKANTAIKHKEDFCMDPVRLQAQAFSADPSFV